MPQNGEIVRNTRTGEMGVYQDGQVVPMQQDGPVSSGVDPSDAIAAQNSAISAQNAARGDAQFNYQVQRDRQEDAQKEEERRAKAAQQETGIQDAAAQMRRVIAAARDAKALSNEWFATGFGADTAKGYGGTTAADVKALLNTIGSNTAFDRLQRMREDSPTGGALGAVSEIELQLLRDSIASLDQSQSDAQFQSNMDKIIEAYQGVLGRIEAASPAPQSEQRAAPPAFAGVNPDGRVVGNDHNNGGDGSMGLAQGGTTQRDNPMLAGIRNEYLARLGRGDSAESIIKWARDLGVHPSVFSSIGAQVRYRRANPHVALSEYDTSELDDEVISLSGGEQAINSLAQSPLGAGAIAAGDAASGFTLDEIVGATGGDADRARLGMAQVAAQNPVSNALGTIAGGATMALGGEAALGARGMAAGLPRAVVADSAYGAAAGAGGADDGNRLAGAAMGALAGAGGSVAGYKTGNALAKLARGVSNPSVNALRGEGVNALTVGQTFANSGKAGAAVKGVEDRIAGLPVVGDMVNARRAEGYRQFNARAFDKALEPIGGTVGDAVGEEAVERAQQQVSEAFTSALAGRGVTPDEAFANDLGKAVMGVRSIKRVGEEVTDEISEILRPYGDEAMLSGEALDDISRSLRSLKGAYRNDPLSHRVGKQIDRVERAVFDLFDRQASGTIEGYNKARQAYRRLSVLEDAVLKAKNTEGVFSTGQLGMADRSNAVKYGGKRAAARGGGVFHDYQRAAQNVLPNKVPDSGTAGRVLIPLALVGGGGGLDAAGGGGVGTGLTIGTILAALYSRTGQRLLTKPGRGMKPGTTRRRVLESDKTQRAIGAAGAAGSAAALVGPE